MSTTNSIVDQKAYQLAIRVVNAYKHLTDDCLLLSENRDIDEVGEMLFSIVKTAQIDN